MRVWRITSGFLVAAFLAVAMAAARPAAQPAGSARQDAAAPVLVLPFVNLTGDPAEDWIGAGIAEALAAGFPAGTAVVGGRDPASAPSTSAEAPVSAARAVDAGRALDVPFVLVGAYQRFGSRLRITARVVAVETGDVVRSAIVDGHSHDLFDLQDRVVLALTAPDAPAGAIGTPREEAAGGVSASTARTSSSERAVPSGRTGPFGRPGPPARRPPATRGVPGEGPAAPFRGGPGEAPPVAGDAAPGFPGGDPAALASFIDGPPPAGGRGEAPPAAAAEAGAVASGGFLAGNAAALAPLIDGPPPPAAPKVMNRDEAGRATVRAIRLDGGLRLDGVLDEAVYETVPPITGFIQQLPDPGAPATERTEAWITFDDTNVYVSARVWDSAPESRWVANEMRRDTTQLRQNDTFTAFFDTFYDRRNGFNFYTNPLGARSDSQFTNEGNPNNDWNPVWDVRTGRFPGGWTVEMEIPFKTLRYPKFTSPKSKLLQTSGLSRLRIPVKSITHSGRNRSPIPAEIDHSFRPKPITRSERATRDLSHESRSLGSSRGWSVGLSHGISFRVESRTWCSCRSAPERHEGSAPVGRGRRRRWSAASGTVARRPWWGYESGHRPRPRERRGRPGRPVQAGPQGP